MADPKPTPAAGEIPGDTRHPARDEAFWRGSSVGSGSATVSLSRRMVVRPSPTNVSLSTRATWYLHTDLGLEIGFPASHLLPSLASERRIRREAAAAVAKPHYVPPVSKSGGR